MLAIIFLHRSRKAEMFQLPIPNRTTNNVRIVVVKVSGSRVVLGVEAPDHVTILREELALEDEPCLASFES